MALKKLARERTDIRWKAVASAHCAVQETAHTGVCSLARESQISVLSSGSRATQGVNRKIGS